MSRAAALVWLLGATTVWGATFPVVKAALADTGPLTFMALRFSLAGAVLAIDLVRRRERLPRTAWPYWCGLSLLAGYLLQTWGLVTATPARSAFITAFSVVLVPLLEPLAGLGRLSPRTLAGGGLALAGLGVLLRPGSDAVVVGDVLTVGCAVAFAFHTMLVQRAVRESAPRLVNGIQVLVVAALALPAAGLERWRLVPTPALAGSLVVTALLATVVAFWAFTAAQRRLTAGETAVVLAWEPVAAALISLLLGEDALTVSLLGGGALVVAGVVLATSAPA
ncbi:MAG TPA: DMT family transporter [Thermoanaerobaculaceae bacterium]|mgnify:CR=1 FL=1|nr:DMT family transporter [Thermoanaerobaculaceae bacterium]HRS17296.1 DMT family transporter [Thermoanaerobaculaceae bacterium]